MSDTNTAPPEPAPGVEQPAPESQETEGQGAEGEAPEQAAPEGEAEPETPPEKPLRELKGIQKRFSDMSERVRNATREAAEAKAELDRLRTAAQRPASEQPKPVTPGTPEFDRAVQQAAQQLAAQQRQQAEQQAAQAERATWFAAGEKENPAFRQNCVFLGQLADEVAPNSSAADNFLEAVMDLPNGHAVTAQLAADPDEAERIMSIKSPAKMALALAKLAAAPPPAPAVRPVSKAPAPIKPVSGTAKGGIDIYDQKLSYAEQKKEMIRLGIISG